MADIEQIFQAIHGLPVRDRLRLVERVVRELAEAPLSDGATGGESMLGLFADEPDAVDEMMETVMEMRRRSSLRAVGDEDAAGELAGRIYADLRGSGRTIGVPDTMIAAIAVHNSLPLITGNASDYVRVQEAGYPLKLGNWRER